ncbi:MAG: hypothetical protein HKN13_10020 [Rhodothermales bacterium]|nr:hypothetical protein [Rhodothermales bacterium]
MLLTNPVRRLVVVALAVGSWSFQSATGQAETTYIPVEIFDPGYLEGDSNYHSLTAASDAMIYFSVNSHHPNSSAQLYRFNPYDESIVMIGNVSDELGVDVKKQVPHGKVHTPLAEHDGYLYFATHTSQYDGNLPQMVPSDGRTPYPGGHFMRYNLENGDFEDLAQLGLSSEGIITMAVDTTNETLYGLTWPTGLLVSYSLEEGHLRNWGAVQGRGEGGRLPEEWDFINREMGIDPAGNLYGSTDTGRLWHFEAGKQRPVAYMDPLSLDRVPRAQDSRLEYPAEPHFFWRNWRTIVWNPRTSSFWGLHGGSTTLFEFRPADGVLRSVVSMQVDRAVGTKDGHQLAMRNPFRTQLGFMLGPNNTLYYLAHGPAIAASGRRDAQTSVHLLTFDIDAGVLTDHGVLIGEDNRRVFFTESIEIGPDDHVYSVAWVETIDPERMELVQAARGLAVPEETEDVIYEIQLVRLPKFQEFAD